MPFLYFETPYPTQEIQIGHGNLLLSDTTDANVVNVLHWSPWASLSYLLFPKAVPYSISGLSLLRVKHSEQQSITTQNTIKTNDSYSISSVLKNKTTTAHSITAQNAVKQTIQDSLMVQNAIYELTTAASILSQNTIKTNDTHSIAAQNTIKTNDTSSYATQLKNVEAVEKSLAVEHHVYQLMTSESAMVLNRIKNYESISALALNRIKENYTAYLTSLLEVIETFSKGKWKNMTATQCDSFIPDYVHGMASVGYNFANGSMEMIMENKGENLADLTYKQTQYSDTKDGFDGNTGYAKNGGIAMAFIPCRPGTYTLKLPDTYQLRDTDKILLYDCYSLPNTNFEATDEAWKISSEDFNGRELSITTTGNWLGFGIYSNEVTYYEVDFTDFQLVNGTTVGEKKGGYGWQELPELHGIDGEYSDLNTKKVECETGISGTGSVTSNGEVFVAINESTGETTWGDLSGGKSLSLAAGTYTVVYVLSEAITQESKNILVARLLSGLDNNFFVSECKLDTFAGDGTTTVFTLTATANNTNYEIFVAGIKQSSGVTKTTTGFTFATAPKRGAIIEAKYNLNFNMTWFAEVNVYEPSGTEVTISGIPELSISANKEFYEREDRLGDKERKEKTQDYTITLNADLLEDAQSFYDVWKDKKFRMIVENTNGSTYKKDIASICSIEGCTKDYLGAIQSITIKATNYYEGVTA